MKEHVVTGGGGIKLHVVETGRSSARALLFIHGFSQSSLAWTRQLSSELNRHFRLVAFDLRGHGLSDKPRDAYGDSRLWADDVNAVIRALDLEQPVLCGWSYGPLVILDYIRNYGENDIGGVNFVGGVTKLGSEEATSVLADRFLALVPGFFSADAEESVRSLDGLLTACFDRSLSAHDRYLMLGYNVRVPPHVRQALFARSIDNDDLLPKLRMPVLISQGAADAVVKTSVLERQMSRIATAQIHLVADACHACFWDEAATYNQRLRAFVEAL